MKGPSSYTVLTSILLSMMSVGMAHAATTTTFSDVSSSHPYYDSILWLANNGVIQGYADGTFKPENPVNRAEMLKMIFIADGNEDDAEAALADGQMFPDTPKSSWYAKYVALARKRGTVQGYPDGYFRPERNINKAEAYKIVLKEFYNETTMSFAVSRAALPTNMVVPSDMNKNDWFAVYVNFAAIKNFYNAGEYGGSQNGNPFYAGQNLTRGQLAELIVRAKAVADNFPNNIEDVNSIFNQNTTIPFSVNLYAYTALESSGQPTNWTIQNEGEVNTTFSYATKYPSELLNSNGDTPNTLKFMGGTNKDMLDITIVTKKNADKLSLVNFYKLPGTQMNYYDHSESHEDIMVNALPAVWFHKVGDQTAGTDEVVVVQFGNAIAEITDHGSRHQADGVFNYLVRNFWFKNFAV